jgi:hypothetical protein
MKIDLDFLTILRLIRWPALKALSEKMEIQFFLPLYRYIYILIYNIICFRKKLNLDFFYILIVIISNSFSHII